MIGSNVFNLAALLGLAGIVAGKVALHRRVIELGGAVALWTCVVTLALVTGVCSPLLGLLAVLAVLAPYAVILGMRHDRLARLRLPLTWASWLAAAISEEETELQGAIHPARGRARDALIAAGAVLAVVGASIAMERAASQLGSRHAVPGIIIGAFVLAAVTSLPNAVAAIYLAARGKGAAVLSTGLNSNLFNILAGLLIPTTIRPGRTLGGDDVRRRVLPGDDSAHAPVRLHLSRPASQHGHRHCRCLSPIRGGCSS